MIMMKQKTYLGSSDAIIRTILVHNAVLEELDDISLQHATGDALCWSKVPNQLSQDVTSSPTRVEFGRKVWAQVSR